MEMVQTVVMNKNGQLSLTLLPKQADGVTSLVTGQTSFFLNSALSDGENGTPKALFYILIETSQDLSIKKEEASQDVEVVLDNEEVVVNS